MALKYLVKVSEVNNLSDARYCAGMGVEMLGFCLDETHPKFIELARLREISVWVSGVKVVGEFTGDDVENINYLAEQLNLDYIQLSHSISLDHIRRLKKPIILKLDFDPENIDNLSIELQTLSKYIDFFILESSNFDSVKSFEKLLESWCLQYKIILGFGIKREDLDEIVNVIKPYGIGLKGGHEIKPGLKDFEELSEILEALEVEC
jgi:phosphoribosylanthranilate isomerase